MSQALIDRMRADHGWPLLADLPALDAHIASPGIHCLFVPGDPAKNLESGDVAVILPELVAAFRGLFDAAVVAEPIERAVRERYDVWPTPSLIFVGAGAALGAIPRVRDWEDYLVRTRAILSAAAQPAH